MQHSVFELHTHYIMGKQCGTLVLLILTEDVSPVNRLRAYLPILEPFGHEAILAEGYFNGLLLLV